MNNFDNKSNRTICFPFEYVSINGQKCSFLENVEEILKADLQAGDSFGCMIQRCHTHAGSKIHFRNFIEAEILFHNNYYNHGFAYLTVEEILARIEKEGNKYKHIYLIGYESYSELYLREVVRQLEAAKKDNSGNLLNCNYFIYETIASGDSSWKKTEPNIRNLIKYYDTCKCYYGLPSKDHGTPLPLAEALNECLFVYIVPINTTLSTMDKMISLFERECGLAEQKNSVNRMCLCLITIGPQAEKQSTNIYWEKEKSDQRQGDILKPKEGKFLNLFPDGNHVRSFAFIESTWTYAKRLYDKNGNSIDDICEDCYPDKANRLLSLKDETPIFDVTRGSVVPMLQLGQIIQLEPVPQPVQFSHKENIKRVWAISEYTAHHHIVRGNNHFQFYLDSPGFLSAYSIPSTQNAVADGLSIADYLLNIRKKCSDEATSKVIYNYIVAPSHRTNAAWVNLVCSYIFTNEDSEYKESFNGARVLYFDITKEYRSNFKAKYSDFFQSFSNIIQRGQNYEIRFHYVDETISSGSRFLRAADLVQSLISSIPLEKKELERIKLFHSVFLLYGRSSYDSRLFYYRLFKEACINDIDELMNRNFHEYVSIRISQMRNYKDACVLCKMTDDYLLIQRYCATNLLATFCNAVIDKHKPTKALVLAGDNQFYCPKEKRYVFLITHILNSRLCLSNSPLFPKENPRNRRQIDVESESASSDIKEVLSDYYSHLGKWLSDLIPDFKNTYCSEDFQSAFIKAISRPFFTFHLRKRQAAFSFCIELLDKHLKSSEKYDSRIQTLINALADMNANYLIREEPFEKLCNLADMCKEGTIHYCRAIKKMMTLSQDTTKSLLLENILVHQSETRFFGLDVDSLREMGFRKYNGLNAFIHLSDNRRASQNSKSVTVCGLSIKGIIYLENNRIINDALKDICNNPSLTRGSDRMPYFLDNYKSLIAIHGATLSETFGDDYKNLVISIEKKRALPFLLLNAVVNSILPDESDVVCDNFWMMPFVRIKAISNNTFNHNKLFEFVHFCDGEGFEDKKLFYRDENFHILHGLFHDAFDDSENSFESVCKDVVFGPQENVCIRFLPFIRNHVPRDESWIQMQGNSTDCALYVQIKNFNKHSPIHWLRLKSLLSLRAAIAEMTAAINMPEAIERKLNEMLHTAISDKKSQMHENIDSALIFSFWQNHPEEYGIKKITESIKLVPNSSAAEELTDVVLRLYNRYYSLLSDELVASWYRKLIRREKGVGKTRQDRLKTKLPTESGQFLMKLFRETQNTTSPPAITSVEEYMTNLFNADFYKELTEDIEGQYKIGHFEYFLSKKAGEFSVIHVNLYLRKADCENILKGDYDVHSLSISGSTVSRCALFHILVLLINNAAVHGKGDEIRIVFDALDGSIHVENSIETNSPEKEEKKLQECLHILPFIRNDGTAKNGGITIWTLKHLVKNQNWFNARIDKDCNRFIATINKAITPIHNNS